MGNTKIKIPNLDGTLTSAYINIPNLNGEITKIYAGNDLVYQKITTSTITPVIASYGQISPSTTTTGNVGTQETFYLTFPTIDTREGVCNIFYEVKLHNGSTNYQVINRTTSPILPQTTPDLFSGNPYISIPATYQTENCNLTCSIAQENMSATRGFSAGVSLTSRQVSKSVTFTLTDICSYLSRLSDTLEGGYMTIAMMVNRTSTYLNTIAYPNRAIQDVTIYQDSSAAYTTTLSVNQSGTFTLAVTRGTSATAISVEITIYCMMFW